MCILYCRQHNIRLWVHENPYHSQVVAQTMREECNTSSVFQDLILIAFEDSKLEQAINGDSVSMEMNIIPQDSFFQRVGGVFLHLENDIIDLSAFLAELSINRECSRLDATLAIAKKPGNTTKRGRQ